VSSGLYFWFEGDQLIGANGSAIAQLTNSTPIIGALAPANATGAGATIGSAGLNGLNVAVFPGSSAGRYSIPQLAPLLLQSTIFFVGKVTSFSSSPDICSGSTTNGLELRFTTSGQLLLTQSATANIGSSLGAATAGTYFQGNVSYNSISGAYAFRVSSAASGSGTNAKTIASPTALIGYNNSGSPDDFPGAMAELIIYNRVLASAEISAVEGYLFSKWGV
jgi:hypothetical protein